MKRAPTLRKIADLLAKWSWNPSKPEELSPERVQAVLNIIAEYSTHDAFRLRCFYVHSLKSWFHRHCAQIEFYGPYTVSFFEQCREKIQKEISYPLSYIAQENPHLLSGFCIRYRDKIWSRNVRDNLHAFLKKQTL
jgi:hypothetical protein